MDQTRIASCAIEDRYIPSRGLWTGRTFEVTLRKDTTTISQGLMIQILQLY